MKILFFNPARSGKGNLPLNIPILIGVLKKNGHNVKLFDLSDYSIFSVKNESFENKYFKPASINENRIIDDRKRMYRNDYGKAVTGVELKKTDYLNDLEFEIGNFKPNLIAISCLSVDFQFAAEILIKLKEKYSIPTIFGGIHAILLPEKTIGSKAVDYICTGEGEHAIICLINALENEDSLSAVKGIWYKKGSTISKNPPIELTDLHEIPIPDYDEFDPIHLYRPFDGKTYKMLNYELSRGCPYNCSYCVNSTLKKKYRNLGKYHRIKESVQSIDELKFLISKYEFDFIRYYDEDFASINIDYLKKYANLYIKNINLPFLIYARVDSVTEAKVKILKDMGCKTFAMGIESGSEFIRKKVMNRKMSNDTIIDKFNLVKSHGIRVSAYNIIGVPYDTRKTIFDTIDLNRKIQPDSFSVTMLEPYKGTSIRQLCEEEGLDPNHETFFDPKKPQFIPKSMKEHELLGLYRTFPFYIRFPRERFNIIKEAETDDAVYMELLDEYSRLK